METLIAAVIGLIWLLWHVTTLNDIKRASAKAADHAERQTKLLAAIANRIAPAESEEPATTERAIPWYCNACSIEVQTREAACPMCKRYVPAS